MPKKVDTWEFREIDRVVCEPNRSASGELKVEMFSSNGMRLRSREVDCDLKAFFRLVNSEVTS